MTSHCPHRLPGWLPLLALFLPSLAAALEPASEPIGPAAPVTPGRLNA